MKRIELGQLSKLQQIDLVQQQTDKVQELTDTVLHTGICKDIRGPRPNRHHKT